MGLSRAESAPSYPRGNFPARVKRSQRAGAGPRSLPSTRHCESMSMPSTCTSSGAGRARKEEGGISRGKWQREPGIQPAWGDRKGSTGAAIGWTRDHCPVSSHLLSCRAVVPWPRTPSRIMPRHVRSHCSGCEQSPCSPWGHTGTEGVGSSPGSDPISLASSDVTGSVPLVPRAQATTGR